MKSKIKGGFIFESSTPSGLPGEGHYDISRLFKLKPFGLI
jgi:hypothetical protein